MRGNYFLFQNRPKVVGVGLALVISGPFEHVEVPEPFDNRDIEIEKILPYLGPRLAVGRGAWARRRAGLGWARLGWPVGFFESLVSESFTCFL
jgi:hypothetical protein